MQYWPGNYPLKIFIFLKCFWAHLNCFPSAQRGWFRGSDLYDTKRVNSTNEKSSLWVVCKWDLFHPLESATQNAEWLPHSLEQRHHAGYISCPLSLLLSSVKFTLRKNCTVNLIHWETQHRGTRLLQRVYIASHCSFFTFESLSGFQMLYLSLYTLLTIWKFIKWFYFRILQKGQGNTVLLSQFSVRCCSDLRSCKRPWPLAWWRTSSVDF